MHIYSVCVSVCACGTHFKYKYSIHILEIIRTLYIASIESVCPSLSLSLPLFLTPSLLHSLSSSLPLSRSISLSLSLSLHIYIYIYIYIYIRIKNKLTDGK